MPSPFYGTDAVYGMRALLGTSNISDIDAGFAALRDDVASKMKGAVPRVTSLPTVGPLGSGALVDGQECYLAPGGGSSELWHLRYRAGSTSAYKWEYVGGSPLRMDSGSAAATTLLPTYGTWYQLGNSLTLPTGVGGDFDITVGGLVYLTNPARINIAYTLGGATPNHANGGWASNFDSSGEQRQETIYACYRASSITAGTTIALEAVNDGSTGAAPGTTFVIAYWLEVRPVRVG